MYVHELWILLPKPLTDPFSEPCNILRVGMQQATHSDACPLCSSSHFSHDVSHFFAPFDHGSGILLWDPVLGFCMAY